MQLQLDDDGCCDCCDSLFKRVRDYARRYIQRRVALEGIAGDGQLEGELTAIRDVVGAASAETLNEFTRRYIGELYCLILPQKVFDG
jgi:hypothetical protein